MSKGGLRIPARALMGPLLPRLRIAGPSLTSMIDQLTLTVHGRRVALLYAGRPPAPAGAAGPPVLVLLHAFPLDSRMWDPQLSVPPPGWAVLAPDFQGFGGSALDPWAETAPSIDDYAADVLTVLDDLGAARAVFAGLSMGGYVAFALLRRAPGRVAGLVLAATRAAADDAGARAGRAATLATLGRDGIGAIAAAMLPRLLAPPTLAGRPDLAARVTFILESADPRAVDAAVRRLRDRPDSSSLLPGIACPTLVVVGGDDVLTPPGEVEAMAARIPGARFELIAGAGHLVNLESPDAFSAALARFCARFPAPE